MVSFPSLVTADTITTTVNAFSSNQICEHGNSSIFHGVSCTNSGDCKDTLPRIKIVFEHCRGEK